MGGDGDILFLFENILDPFVVNIFQFIIVFDHNWFNSVVIPCGLVPMKLVVFRKHLNFFRELFSKILSSEVLLIIIYVVILLKLDVSVA